LPKVVIYRPSWDIPTRYTSYWMGRLGSYARRRGWDVIEVFDDLVEAIETHRPDLIIAGSHGTPTTILGPEEVPVMGRCVNDHVLRGRVAYVVACDTSQELGYSSVEKGCVGWVGFMDDVLFVISPPYDPPRDELAIPEWESITSSGEVLINGGTLREAVDVGVRTHDQWIERLWERPEPDWAQVIMCLQHNRNVLVALGDKEASVAVPPAPVVPWPLVLVGIGLLLPRSSS